MSFYNYSEMELRRVKSLFEEWKHDWLRKRKLILPAVEFLFVRRIRDYHNDKFKIHVYRQSKCCGLLHTEFIETFDTSHEADINYGIIIKSVRERNIESLILYFEHHTSCMQRSCRGDILRAFADGCIKISDLNHIDVSRQRKREILKGMTRTKYLKQFQLGNEICWDLNIEEVPFDAPNEGDKTDENNSK